MNTEARDPILTGLDELAGMADGDQVTDRMAGISRKARTNRIRQGTAAAACLAVVAAGGAYGVGAQLGGEANGNVAPATNPTVGTESTAPVRRSEPPTLNERSDQTTPGLAGWVADLPDGDPPEVPYLEGMALHLPRGNAVDLPGDDAAIVGMTLKGPVVLVEDSSGAEFVSSYLSVDAESGEYSEIPQSLTERYVQDEVSSPDGRFFTSGDAVIDMLHTDVAARLPEDAAVLLSWTGAGIQYADDSGGQWLWEPGSQPWALEEDIWFPSQLDPVDVVDPDDDDAVGLVTTGRCTEVVHVYRGSTYEERWGRRCGGPGVLTMSPEGSWLLTRDLGVVDPVQETTRPLAPDASGELHADTDAYWLSESVVLLALPQGVVRCDVTAQQCERATHRPAGLPAGPG